MANYVHCISLSSLERHSHESRIPSEELGRKAFLADNAGVCVQVEQKPALQPHARSVFPAAMTGAPWVPRALFAPVVRDGYAFTDARVRHTGEIGAAH